MTIAMTDQEPKRIAFRRRRCRKIPEYVVRRIDRKSTRLNSSHSQISYAVFCLKKKNSKADLIRHFNEKPRARIEERAMNRCVVLVTQDIRVDVIISELKRIMYNREIFTQWDNA